MKRVVLLLGTVLLGGCAGLPDNTDRSASFALTNTDSTNLGQSLAPRKASHPGKSGFRVLASGLDAFVARAVLANRAQRSIDAQYYLLQDDLVGRLFVDRLLAAADRGVRVRLLVDDMDLKGRDSVFSALDAHPHVEVRFFNPFSRSRSFAGQLLTGFGSVTRRMHNKSFNVDNQAAILGGRNIGDQYFEANPAADFADLDVLAVGPVVDKVSAAFDLYWNSASAYPALSVIGKRPSASQVVQLRERLGAYIAAQRDSPYQQALRASALAKDIDEQTLRFHWGTAEVLFDHPDKVISSRQETAGHLTTQLRPHMSQIRDELTLISPYFVPGAAGVAWLTSLRNKGIRVRILTNSLASTDIGAVHAGYSKYRKALLRAGVELYELNKTFTRDTRKYKKGLGGSSKASLHAKSFVLDRERVFIGSMNLDPRSVVENTEIGVVIESAEIAQSMSTWFDRESPTIAFRLQLKTDDSGAENIVWHGIEAGEPRVYHSEPHAGFWRRVGAELMGLLPIESQL